MDESRPTSPERLDREDVLAVEEAGHHQLAAPAKLAARLDPEYTRPERHAAGARQLNADGEPGTDAKISVDPPDERIPPRKRLEVGERDPDPVRRCRDLDLHGQHV